MVIHAVRLQADDLLILLDRELQDALGAAARLHIAQRAQIDPSEQAARFEIVGILLNDILRFDHGIANATSFRVKFGEAGGQICGGRVGVNGGAIFFDRFVSQFAAAVSGHLFLIHMREGEVVVGGSAIRCFGFGGRLRTSGFCGLGRLICNRRTLRQ